MSSIYLARHGQSLGSFNEEEVREGISSKRFIAEDLAWRAGMNDWLPLSEVADAWGFDALLLGNVVAEREEPPIVIEPTWERRSNGGFFSALFQTMREVLFSPSMVFSRLETKAVGLLPPLFYYAIMSCVVFAVILLTRMPQILKNPASLAPQLATVSHTTLIAGGIAAMILLPLLSIVGIFISSAINHLSILLVRGDKGTKEPFGATFRVICYAFGSTAIFQLVPIIGAAITIVWVAILYFIGLKKAHTLSGWRTTLAILLSVAIYLALTFSMALSYVFITAHYFKH